MRILHFEIIMESFFFFCYLFHNLSVCVYILSSSGEVGISLFASFVTFACYHWHFILLHSTYQIQKLFVCPLFISVSFVFQNHQQNELFLWKGEAGWWLVVFLLFFFLVYSSCFVYMPFVLFLGLTTDFHEIQNTTVCFHLLANVEKSKQTKLYQMLAEQKQLISSIESTMRERERMEKKCLFWFVSLSKKVNVRVAIIVGNC